MKSDDGQCVQDTVGRALVFGSPDILTPSLQHMYTSPTPPGKLESCTMDIVVDTIEYWISRGALVHPRRSHTPE